MPDFNKCECNDKWIPHMKYDDPKRTQFLPDFFILRPNFGDFSEYDCPVCGSHKWTYEKPENLDIYRRNALLCDE
jgi:hypothetical protein